MHARALTALALVAGATACAAPPPELPPLSATVRQYRSDVPLRMLSATVHNGSAAPVVLSRGQLLARGFVTIPSAELDVVLPPRSEVDVPLAYGRARCGSPLSDDADVARLEVQGAGEVLVQLSARGGLLARLQASECAQQEVQDAVELTLGPGWVRTGQRLEGSLVVRRRSGDEPVTVLGSGGHIVFTVRPKVPAEPLAVLAPDDDQVEVPLVVVATRCDGHALGQNSRSGVFPFHVAVGNGEAVQTPALAGAELAGQLAELARDTCFPGG